jgi:hypothetical protein
MASLARQTAMSFVSNNDDRLRRSRHLDFRALVTNIAGSQLTDDDVDLVAALFLDASENSKRLTKDFLIEGLRQKGRSRDKAEAIVNALIK